MKRNTDMTTGTPIRLIIAFALPLLLGNVFQQLYNFIDTAIVGRYVGADALAAVGTTGSVNTFLVSAAMGLTNGAGIITAQCFGAKNYTSMKKTVTAMIYVTGAMCIIVTIAGIFLAKPIMLVLGVPENILPDSVAYMRIIFSLCFGMMIYNACSSVLRNLGNSKTPLIMLIISSLSNIALDLLFVLKFGMGVKGVAYATVFSQILSAVLCFAYIIRRRYELHLDNIPLLPERIMIKKIFKTGMPAALQSCMISLGGMSVQSLVNSFGKDAMAAYTAVLKIDSLSIQILISVATALSVYSGQNMGAYKLDRIKQGLYQTLAVMVPVCTALAVVMLVFRYRILTIFLDPETAHNSVNIGASYLSVIGIGYIIAGVMQSYQNLLRGCGDVNVCMAAGIAELGVRVAASYLLVQIFGLTGIWAAVPISWGCGCVIPIARYYSGKWQKKRLVS